MNNIRVYPRRDGWFYEVWIGARLAVFGWCATQERAQVQTATAEARPAALRRRCRLPPCACLLFLRLLMRCDLFVHLLHVDGFHLLDHAVEARRR